MRVLVRIPKKPAPPRFVSTWREVILYAQSVLPLSDCVGWLQSMESLLKHPRFLKDPVPLKAWSSPVAMREYLKTIKMEHLMSRTWASPHPNVERMLGCYLVWRPDDFWSNLIYGECEVRQILGVTEKTKEVD